MGFSEAREAFSVLIINVNVRFPHFKLDTTIQTLQL